MDGPTQGQYNKTLVISHLSHELENEKYILKDYDSERLVMGLRSQCNSRSCLAFLKVISVLDLIQTLMLCLQAVVCVCDQLRATWQLRQLHFYCLPWPVSQSGGFFLRNAKII